MVKLKKAFKKTFQYLIFATFLLFISKFTDPLETDITPYVLAEIIILVIVFFVYFFMEKNNCKR